MPRVAKGASFLSPHFKRIFKLATLVSTISPADIDSYRDERLQELNPWKKPITARNVNYEVETIRAFFYYLRRFRDPELKNPAAGLKGLQVTKKIVDSYEEAELKAFFKVCTKEEKAIFKTFYLTGLRDQELATLYWEDIDFVKKQLTVRAKPNLGFIPKDWEEREIPLHPELLRILKGLPRRHPNLVFPTAKGKPNAHFLKLLLRIVKRGNLKGKWYLHKFRKTFGTETLRRGADIRTVQALLGHKDIATTSQYLSTSTDRMRDAVGKL